MPSQKNEGERGDSLTSPRGLGDECGGAMGLTGARWSLVGPISHVNASFMLCVMRVVVWRIVMVWTRASLWGDASRMARPASFRLAWRAGVVCRFVMRLVPHVVLRFVSASVLS